jgi:hypothetical protein
VPYPTEKRIDSGIENACLKHEKPLRNRG